MKASEKKSAPLVVRLDDATKDRLRAEAKARGVTVSEVVREKIGR